MKLFLPLAITIATIGCFLVPSSLASTASAVDQYHHAVDKKDYIGNSLWAFGSSGVHVFSPDGSIQYKHVPPEDVCMEDEDYDGSHRNRKCSFYDVVSDGKKYVWAATERDTAMMDVFDIDTGSIVGSFEACLSPNSLEYHPLREEIWARCGDLDVNGTDPTHLDVISANNPSGQIQTNILVQERALKEGLSSRRSSIVHPDLGDMGYLTDDSLPGLFKIDLSKKDVVGNIALSPPSNGLEDAVYSEVNNHIFVKAKFCCTCGSVEADKEDCGQYEPAKVSPVTGKSAGMKNVDGICGRECDNVDGINNIGVYEFDTTTNTVIATHKLADGMTGRPFVSANGKYIVLLARNGGETIRVLEAGEEGLPSEVLIDLELDFTNRTGFDGQSVAYDFAFVEMDDRTLFVMPSGTSHEVAIVDFTDGKSFDTQYVRFNDKAFDRGRAPHGRYRRVEWAIGTDYVWTDDSDNDELYVIDVIEGRLVNKIPSVESRALLSVQNFERLRIQNELNEAMEVESTMSNNNTDTLAIVAIIIGSLALVVGVLNLVRNTSSLSNDQQKEKMAFRNQHDDNVADIPSQIDETNDIDMEPSLASVN